MKEFSKKYLDFLSGELAGINLTRITSEEDFYNKQILDSILPIEQSSVFKARVEKAKLIVDIGFGGGFPLLPMAKIFPDKKFLGLEARGKKAVAVNKIADHLGLSNVIAAHKRYEDLYFDREVVITFKAVGSCEDILSKFSTSKKLNIFFYKGKNFHELEKLDNVLKEWRLIEEKEIKVPDIEGRILVGFQNRNVPCGTFKNKKKLSHFVQSLES